MLSKLKPSILSALSISVLAICFLWISLNTKPWNQDGFISGDGFGYYAYLPAIVIKKDVRLNFLDEDKHSYFNNLWTSISPTGTRFTKMGAGLAVMQSPFFLTAHAYALASGVEADGFSLPYRFALAMSCLFWCLLGFIFLRKVLLQYFDDRLSAVLILLIGMGTNLLNYTVFEPMMSHAYGFFLFSLLAWLTIEWHKKPTWMLSIAIGFCCGMILLTRTSNGLVFIIPALFGIYNWESFLNKLKMVWEQKAKVLLILSLVALTFFPQLLYHKIVAGQWFYYSYRHEKFYLDHPHLFLGLFGFRKGWLIYTPIMTFALIGIWYVRNYFKEWFLPILVYVPLNLWLVMSWWCWWYGGSYGMRSLIETYAILALPLGAFFLFIKERKRLIRLGFYSLLIFLLLLSAFQTYQYKKQFITWDCMNWPAYKAVLFKWEHLPEGFGEMQECPDYDRAIIGQPERKKEDRK